ncbi:hypothetical protein ACFL47_00455 [Candidatus Latescibacterota bacterium]
MSQKIRISIYVCIGSLAFTLLVFSEPDLRVKSKKMSDKLKNMVLMPPPLKTFDNRMPSIFPNPNIDYKILRVRVSENFDYKIRDAGPRPRIPDDISPRRKRLDPKIFIIPYSNPKQKIKLPEKNYIPELEKKNQPPELK